MNAESVVQQKGTRSYRVRVQESALKELHMVHLPPLFWGEAMDLSHAVDLQLGRKLVVSIVPPTRLFQERKADLAEIFARPRSWLAVFQDQFGQHRGQELELTLAEKEGVLNVRLLRSTGRPVAEGQARLAGKGEVQFELAVYGRARPGPPVAVVRGRLNAAGEWQAEMAFDESFVPAEEPQEAACGAELAQGANSLRLAGLQ
jgi:hypothetical protein